MKRTKCTYNKRKSTRQHRAPDRYSPGTSTPRVITQDCASSLDSTFVTIDETREEHISQRLTREEQISQRPAEPPGSGENRSVGMDWKEYALDLEKRLQALSLQQQQVQLQLEMSQIQSQIPATVAPTVQGHSQVYGCQNVSQVQQPNFSQVQRPTLVMNMPPINGLLPTFAAEETDDPIRFMKKVGFLLQQYNVPVENWIMLIQPQMVGRAKLWIQSIPNIDSLAFAEFKQLFIKKYDSLEIKIKLQAKYYGTMQAYLESSPEFIQKK